MKERNLISMVDYTLEIERRAKERGFYVDGEIGLLYDYANFLKQPLTLGMFVPCGEDGEVLIEPSLYDPRSKTGNTEHHEFDEKEKQYQQAKERVLFEGFDSLDYDIFFNDGCEVVEDLLKYSTIKLTLTETAVKQLGL